MVWHKKKYGFVIDVARCIDCRACLVACSAENSVPLEKTRIWVYAPEIRGEFPDLTRTFIPYNCMHCENPLCVEACVSRATYKDQEHGLVLVDQEACIGCGYCVEACTSLARGLAACAARWCPALAACGTANPLYAHRLGSPSCHSTGMAQV